LGETLEDAALRYAHTEGGSFGGVISKEHMVFRYFKEEARKEILVTAVLVESTSCVETRAPFREPTWFGIEAAETSLSIERDYEYTEELRKVLRWAYSKVQIRTCKQIKVGVIPFRTNGRDIEVLLITSKTHHRWILPKGNMQAGLSAEASALEEALQEAGIEGELVGESLGVHDYSRLGVPHTLEAFPMRVTKTHNDWPEKPARERRWVNIERAATIVEYEHLKQIFVEFQKRVVKNKTKNRHKRGTEAA
jgi:8-oxo-dGTP pyrophosphatase MutT (NUDIX family)